MEFRINISFHIFQRQRLKLLSCLTNGLFALIVVALVASVRIAVAVAIAVVVMQLIVNLN